MLTKTTYQDPYNAKKTWTVEHTSCGHYYLSEYICGKLFGRRERRRKRDIRDIGIFDFKNFS